MNTISVGKFRDNLETFIEKVVELYAPLKVTPRGGKAFVVMREKDWEREQETPQVRGQVLTYQFVEGQPLKANSSP